MKNGLIKENNFEEVIVNTDGSINDLLNIANEYCKQNKLEQEVRKHFNSLILDKPYMPTNHFQEHITVLNDTLKQFITKRSEYIGAYTNTYYYSLFAAYEYLKHKGYIILASEYFLNNQDNIYTKEELNIIKEYLPKLEIYSHVKQ
jgi:hypothetical protein